jgi:VCBS repeat protein/putative Ig domain-containing protein/IPT/TIG domain-containing protein
MFVAFLFSSVESVWTDLQQLMNAAAPQTPRRARAIALCAALLFFVSSIFLGGCGSAAPISIALSSFSKQTDQGQSIGITATLMNSSRGVTWSLNGPGSLSGQSSSFVTYSAPPNVSSSQMATVTATSVADTKKTASLQITVNPPPQISLLVSLPSGTTDAPYNQTIALTGGSPPFTWSLPIGALPNGLSLNASTGAITGTPTGGGTWYFWAHVTDAYSLSADDGFLSLEVFSNRPPGNPVPFVNQPLIPDAAAPGGPGFALTVNGTGFVSGATVNFNGTPLATTFVSSHQLTATVPSSDIASAATPSITVLNPAPGSGRSNVALFPVAAPETTVNFSDAPGSPIPPPIQFDSPSSLAVGDFNGDGKPDLSIAYTVRVNTLLGNGDGTFTQAPGSPILMHQPPWETLASPYAGFVTVGDFDNSGKLGLAVAELQSSNATILLGNRNGSFTSSSAFVYIQNFPTVCLASGDFNSDGNLDLVAAGNGSGLPVVVQLGYGDGAFNVVPSSPFGLSSGVTSIAVGDFNGDGKLDLALGGSDLTTGAGHLTILLGNGDGTFTPTSASPMAVGASYSIAVADFNGDGKLDLAVANYGTNTVTILLGNGDGTFTQAKGSPILVGSTPHAMAAGDFTGSGRLGLAVANFTDNNVSILLGKGDGTFTQSATIPVGKGPYSLAVGDFSGSGRLGLAVANLTDGTVSILVQH